MGVPGVILLSTVPDEVVPHIFPVRITGGLRDAVRQALADKGIETGIHYKPNHLLSYYGARKGSLPVTEAVYDELLSLPLHPEVGDAEQSDIVNLIAGALATLHLREAR
jgi:dTDP-4-amino-4,6-dideoxygalactose transaminase